MESPRHEVTELLRAWSGGNQEALEKLTPLVYVELRFYGGLSAQETAEVLKVSPDTVKRDWRLAKVWMLKEMRGEGGHGSGAVAED